MVCNSEKLVKVFFHFETTGFVSRRWKAASAFMKRNTYLGAQLGNKLQEQPARLFLQYLGVIAQWQDI